MHDNPSLALIPPSVVPLCCSVFATPRRPVTPDTRPGLGVSALLLSVKLREAEMEDSQPRLMRPHHLDLEALKTDGLDGVAATADWLPQW